MVKLGSLVWLAGCVDRNARRQSIFAALAMVIGSLCTMGGSAALALAVSRSVESRDTAVGWFFVAAAGMCGGRLLDVWKARAYALAEFSLERVLTQKVFRASVGGNRHRPVGEQLQELTTMVLGGRLVFQHALFTAPSAVVDAVFAAGFLILFGQTALACFLVGFAIVYVWLSFGLARPIAVHARDVADGRMAASACFGDALLNRDVVRWYGALDFVTRSFDGAFNRVARDTVRLTHARTIAAWWTGCVFAAGYCGSLALAWFNADNHAARVGDVVLASMCVLALIRPLETAAQAMRDLVLAGAWIAPIETLEDAVGPSRTGGATTRGVTVSFRRVSFGYSGGKLFEDVSFEIGKGAVVGLRGPSGAGKSTLLRLLIGDLEPSAGEVRWDDGFTPPSFALAPQETLLLDDSAAANVAFGRDASSAEIERAAHLAGLDTVLAQSGRDLDFKVGERGRSLSGGERQRLALARAILQRRALYVLDEATSALDSDSECAVLRRVVDAMRGSTIVIVSHRESAFSLCDTILELNDARVVACFPASHAIGDTAPRS